MYAGVTKSLKFIIQLTKENVVYHRYSVTHLTWIPIKMPFLGRRKPVDIKALRKAVWAFAPKQATYTEVNKQHFRIWKQGLQSNIVFFETTRDLKPWFQFIVVSLYFLISSPLQWKPFHISTADRRHAVLATKTWAPEEKDARMRFINMVATRVSYHK